MKTLIIGDMTRAEEFLHWMEVSKEYFEVELVISENRLESQYFFCPIEPIEALGAVEDVWDIIFICSLFYQEFEKVLLMCGISHECIKSDIYFYKTIPKSEKMSYYADKSHKEWNECGEILQIGDFSYTGELRIYGGNIGKKIVIGKYCSIADGVGFVLAEHNVDWCTTYPFNKMMYEFEDIKGHPKSKGDVIIGNDVWIGVNSMILSGVHIGDGCIVAANSTVTKNVEEYSIVGGNPARVIRKRFDIETIKKLKNIKWWNWEKEYIYDAIPILQSNDIEGLVEYYENVVRDTKKKDRGGK